MTKRLFLLFLDGADYAFTRAAQDAGRLPNLTALARGGTVAPLATSFPAESPVAFAEVLTGCNPGKHGIFDFLHRDAATRMPAVSLFERTEAGFRNAIAAPTLCEPLARAGVRSALIRVPGAFPPPPGADLVVGGLGVPDAGGSWGLAQVFTRDGGAGDLFGTRERAWRRDGESLMLDIESPHGGIVTQRLRLAGGSWWWNTTELPFGRFGPWLAVDSPGGRGLAAAHVSGTIDDPVITLTPIWARFDDERLGAVHPHAWARERASRTPPTPAAGWPEPNLLHARGRVSFEAFFDLASRCAADFESMTFDVLADPSYDLVIANHELFDRAAHAGFGDTADAQVSAALVGVLERFDAFIGAVRAHFPDAEVWVASDHGFAPWRRRVNLNRWLYENGFLVAEIPDADPDLASLQGGVFWAGVDWSRTRAYAMGLSKIYLNLEGREPDGVVAPGKPARELTVELMAKLGAWRDAATGTPVIRRVLESRRLYWGQALGRAGDLVVCYEPGYRTDWVSSLGGLGTPALADNDTHWRADHCGVDPELIPGILILPRAINTPNPCLRDLAPSILRHFGVTVDAPMDGRVLWSDE